MNRISLLAIIALALATTAHRVSALSETLHRPKIFWPKNHNGVIAAQVHQVLNSDKFKYLEGMTSYWEPKWPTTLAYDGDAQALSAFIKALNEVQGITVRLTFSMDLSKESRGSLAAGSWWVEYAHTTPDTLTIRINLAAETLGREKLELTLPKTRP